mmetsp:Transcript_52503/g.162947  ORF Transcript_52503/g.162947 Transcript_52503/m.162947 type:complete len:352 (-) Transcript_52503:418-1473(-)
MAGERQARRDAAATERGSAGTSPGTAAGAAGHGTPRGLWMLLATGTFAWLGLWQLSHLQGPVQEGAEIGLTQGVWGAAKPRAPQAAGLHASYAEHEEARRVAGPQPPSVHMAGGAQGRRGPHSSASAMMAGHLANLKAALEGAGNNSGAAHHLRSSVHSTATSRKGRAKGGRGARPSTSAPASRRHTDSPQQKRQHESRFRKHYEEAVKSGLAKELMHDPFPLQGDEEDSEGANAMLSSDVSEQVLQHRQRCDADAVAEKSSQCMYRKGLDYLGVDVETVSGLTADECCCLCRLRDEETPGSCDVAVLSGPSDTPPQACWLKHSITGLVEKKHVVACLPPGTDLHGQRGEG